MKKVNLLLLCFLAVNFFSCSSDDSSDSPDNEGVNAQEEELLEVNAVTSGIIIDGASVVSGSPTPTGDLPFSLDYSKQSAFQKNGFDVKFQAPSDFAGAYIQLKDADGMADSYFDIPASATSNSGKMSLAKRDIVFNKKASQASKVDDISINIDFEEAVTAGTFCYIICVYDSQGNISQPSDVCVTVESWGGSNDLIGNWNFAKSVDDGITIAVGEQDCYEENLSLECNNEETLDLAVSYCDIINSLVITFNTDGTYTFVENTTDTNFDWDATLAACEKVDKEENDVYTSSGKWAFNEEENKLTLVEFEYTETYDGETETETIEDGELLIDNEITLSSSNLVITITDSDPDEEEDSYDFHFTKN